MTPNLNNSPHPEIKLPPSEKIGKEPEKPSKSKSKSKWNYLNKAITLIDKTFHTIDSTILSPIEAITGLIKTVLKPVLTSKAAIKVSDTLGEINKVSIVFLISIPFTFYHFGKSIKGLFDAKDAKDSTNAYIDASLITTATAGSIIAIPGQISNVIEMFKPITQMATWAPFLGIVSSVLSLASLVYTARSHKSSRDLLNELEETSTKAVIKQLQSYVNDPYLDKHQASFFKALGSKEGKLELQIKINNLLDPLGNVKDASEAKKFVEDIQSKLAKIEPPDLRSRLQAAGDAAYIDCLKKQDDAILSKHFQVEGGDLKKRLREISNVYKTTEKTIESEKNIRGAVSNLKGRVKEKISSDKVSIGMNSVGLVASTIFLGSSFTPAIGVALPVAFILTIGLSLVTIAKMYFDYESKQEFEEAMGIYREKPTVDNQTVVDTQIPAPIIEPKNPEQIL